MSKDKDNFDITLSVKYYKKFTDILKGLYGSNLSNRIRILLSSMFDKHNNDISINKLSFKQRMINEDIKEYYQDIDIFKNKIHKLESKIEECKNEIQVLKIEYNQVEEAKNLLIELNNNFSSNQIDYFNNIIQAYNQGVLKDNLFDYIPNNVNYSSFLNELTIYLSSNLNKEVVGVTLEEKKIKSIIIILKEGVR